MTSFQPWVSGGSKRLPSGVAETLIGASVCRKVGS